MYDTIVIGAGLSGLAAGIRLAHFGQRVCLLERHTTIGGLNSFYRLHGRNYDVGLHAVTNYTPKGARRGPLVRLLRQLRISWDELGLVPQLGSAVAFPGVKLRFSNDFALFQAEVERCFPRQCDNLARLGGRLIEYERLGEPDARGSARQVLRETITDPLLVEMICCPVFYYGSAQEHDMDFGQFSVIFRSIFLEGFARPREGIRRILKLLTRKYKALGGELRLRSGVERLIVERDRVERVILDDGQELSARHVLSSAGWDETLRLCQPAENGSPFPHAGPAGSAGSGHGKSSTAAPRMTFAETVSVLDRPPDALGVNETITFFNDRPDFTYAVPDEMVDLRSGVLCVPNHFAFDMPLDEGMVRVCQPANYARWAKLDPAAYAEEKRVWYERIVAAALRHVPDFRGAVVATDMFTPVTIHRFTGHVGGAVYGSPEKRYDGTTPLGNLFLCGSDQGMVGIVGTILSGISMANRHLLAPEAARG